MRIETITEIINLEAILNLPKGTEHFVSDLHGEYEAFQHILRNGSGNVKQKVTAVFHRELNQDEINELSFLIYYPEEILVGKEDPAWLKEKMEQLVQVVRFASSKYTRSKVRKAIPKVYQYILEELIFPVDEEHDKHLYYNQILSKIIQLGQGKAFITVLCYLIQRLVVDHLHVVGDIYDRGPAPDKIMDTLMAHHSVDIQWGNHDMIWIGAFSGSLACLANVIRICARYSNLDLLEAYEIDLSSLSQLAEKYYEENPRFVPKRNPYVEHTVKEKAHLNKVQQAIAMIQFKLEGQLLKRRPEFMMDGRLLLDKVDFAKEEITIGGVTHSLLHPCFQTVDKESPYTLIEEETEVVETLMNNFQQSEKLKRHMDFLMDKGSLYLIYNGNLLIHGCIPMTEEGDFQTFLSRKGKDLFDAFEKYVRDCYQQPDVTDDLATDMVWYLWCGEHSTLFDKHAMTTFERYFIEDQATHEERANPYYRMREDKANCEKMLAEFGLVDPDTHIINGHTPVKEKAGENPIKAGGKMIVIDGGYSRAYQKTTGIAGYTLLYNSYGLQLVAHQPFVSKEEAIKHRHDIVSVKRAVSRQVERKRVKDTTIGKGLMEEMKLLEEERG